MKRAGLALGLLLGFAITYEVVTSGPDSIGVTVFRHRNSGNGGAPFSFAFAPPGGAGLRASCACDGGITDSVGRAVVFSRASVAYCEKGDIDNPRVGDLVQCAANLPRVMPGGDGTGILGLNIEEQRTNDVQYSEQMDNVALWTAASSTVTANACAAPNGAMTGERVDFGASASGVNSSVLYQATVDSSNNESQSVYLCGIDGGTTIDAPCVYDGSAWHCTTCTIPWCGQTDGGLDVTGDAGIYTRCLRDNVKTAGYFLFGNAGINGGGTHNAVSVCAWGGQQENGHSTTSYIPTLGASGTRNSEIAHVALYVPAPSNLGSSAQFVPENGLTSGENRWIVEANDQGASAANAFRLLRASSNLLCESRSGGINTDVTSLVSIGTAGTSALSCRYDGSANLTNCVDATCLDAGMTAISSEEDITIGSSWNGSTYQSFANGVVKNVTLGDDAKKDIYLIGDSIVFGAFAGAGFHPQEILYREYGNKLAVTNEAVSGFTIDQCQTTWNARVATIVANHSQARSYMMLQCGINSSPDAGGTLGEIEAMLLLAQDAGIHTLGSTITPDYSAGSPYIVNVNNALNAWAPGVGITVAQTWSALVVQDGGTALADAYNSGDGEHPNDAGTYLETIIWQRTGNWAP